MMNERIKLLITSIGIMPEDEHYDVAELIVKECADVVRTSLLPSQNKVPATVALDIAAKNIELLFGVKE